MGLGIRLIFLNWAWKILNAKKKGCVKIEIVSSKNYEEPKAQPHPHTWILKKKRKKVNVINRD
jgi:hypothetical protein